MGVYQLYTGSKDIKLFFFVLYKVSTDILGIYYVHYKYDLDLYEMKSSKAADASQCQIYTAEPQGLPHKPCLHEALNPG